VVDVRNDGDVTNLVHGTILEIEEREYGRDKRRRQPAHFDRARIATKSKTPPISTEAPIGGE
jgi:hypothetical protein